MKLTGKPVSRGVVIGEVLCYEPFTAVPTITYIEAPGIPGALAAYRDVLETADRELEELCGRIAQSDPDKAKILTAHRDILKDPVMDEEVRGLIEKDRMSPDAAVAQVYDNYILLLGKSRNETMRERASDLRDVKNRMLRCFAGVKERSLGSLERPVIVVAGDLFPSDTVSLDRKNVMGIVTQVGGATSHTAIIARSYEIPAVLGVVNALSHLKDGDTVILDAVEGEILLEPGAEDIAFYTAKAERVREEQRQTKAYLCTEPVTRDGHRVKVGLNIASANDHELSGADCTDGSGLFRTEFLYLGQERLPDEEEQFRIYKKVLLSFGDKPVTLRTLDIGGDKQLCRLELPREDNPFLGLRGLRLCLVRTELFGAQIRAALRASVYGNLRIMLPMVGALDEIRKAKAFIYEQGALLDEKGIPWNRDIPIGIMIEVPSIAFIADLVVPEVDFVSVGTNDLCQYLNAADRMNPAVKPYYQEYHPAMFRILGLIAREFEQAGKQVSICGEMAGDVLAIPALLGLGIDKFSMGLASVAAVKRVIRSLDMDRARALAAQVQQLKTDGEIRAHLQAFADEMAG